MSLFSLVPRLSLAAVLFLPGLALAHIGEDLATLRKVYGSAKDMGDQMLFQHDGYSISVSFDAQGLSTMEIFVRDGSQPAKKEITSQDIQDLLAAEGDGQAWSPITTHSGEPTWLRADHKRLARFNSGDQVFTVMVDTK